MRVTFAELDRLEKRRELKGIGSEGLLVLGALSLPGPDITEFAAANLFPTETIQALIDDGRLYRAAGGTVAPEPKVRRILRSALEAQPFRRRMHLFVVERLRAVKRAVPKSERLPLLAHHAREAREVKDAVTATMSLARYFRSHDRSAESIDWLRSVLQIVRDKKTKLKVLEALREAAHRNSDQKTALWAARRISKLDPTPDTLRVHSWHAVRAGRLSESLHALGKGLQLDPSPRQEAHILANRAATHIWGGEVKKAKRDLNKVEALKIRITDKSSLFGVYTAFGIHYTSRRAFSKALEHFRTAASFVGKAGDLQQLIRASENAGITAIQARLFEEARTIIRFLRRTMGTRPRQDSRAMLMVLEGWIYLEEGQSRKAFKSIYQAAKLYEIIGNPRRQAEMLQNAGYVALDFDDNEIASDLSQESIEFCNQIGDPKIRIRARCTLAQAHARLGLYVPAESQIREARSEAESIEYPLARQFVLRAELEIAQQLGQWKRVHSLAKTAESYARKIKDLPRAVEFRFARADALIGMGRLSSATKCLDSILELAGSLNPTLSAEARLRWLECKYLSGISLPPKQLSRLEEHLSTPRRKARWLRLKANIASDPKTGMGFAIKAVGALPFHTGGRDALVSTELAGDIAARGGNTREAVRFYRETARMREEWMSNLPPSWDDSGDLLEMSDRLDEKFKRHESQLTSALDELSSLDELIRRGAPTEHILTQLLAVLSRLTGIRSSAVARSARGRWKVLASRELESSSELPFSPTRPSTKWRRHPLIFRGETLGVLIYRKPRKKLDWTSESLLEILATRAAESLHHDRSALRSIEELARQERQRPRSRAKDPSASPLEYRAKFEAFMGAGAAHAEIVARAYQASQSMVNILLIGETGTGKEILARCIHGAGVRNGQPFVIVACAALSNGIIESELFGHERGAFSGAHRKKIGLVTSANGGTLFLDGVEELPVEAQAALLRVLEERRVRPVGAVRDIPVDFRLISAASRDPVELTAERKFRKDLHHRIQGISLTLTPLRERPEDIPLLANHFAQDRISLTPDALTEMISHPWPGNVRELRNLIEVLCTSPNGPVEAEQIRALLPAEKNRGPSEADMILDVLQQTPNVGEAAERLGVSRATLYRKLRQFGITPPTRS